MWVTGAGVRADMMSCHREVTCRTFGCACAGRASESASLCDSFTSLGLGDRHAPMIALPIDGDAYPQGTPKTAPVRILADRQNSLDLCLYSLIGLGLYRSGRCIKRSSLGFLPPWYGNNDLSPIGQGLGLSAHQGCGATVCCFVQPDHLVRWRLPQSRLRAIVSLWRDPQFTPYIVSPRGPPLT